MRRSLFLIGTIMQLVVGQAAIAQTVGPVYEMPKECRMFRSAKLEKCLAASSASAECAMEKEGQRVKCAKEIIGLKDVPTVALKKCRVKAGMEKKACEKEVKDKIITSVIFSFDDLTAKAARANKISSTKLAKFNKDIESAKVKFNTAKTYSERVKIVQKVKTDWNKFVKANKGKITTKNNLDNALKDLKSTK